jgi:elongation factor Ts
MVDIKAIKELRDKTGIGMTECKRALEKTDGDVNKAIDVLRIWGLNVAKDKSTRTTSEGVVSSYIHPGGKVGVLIEVACETDFVARTDAFKELVSDLSMQVAASAPKYVSPETIPSADLDAEANIVIAQVAAAGKSNEIAQRMVEGKMKKFKDENSLLEQPFVKDPKRKIKDVVADAVAKLGENIQVKRFARFKLGEELGISPTGAEDMEARLHRMDELVARAMDIMTSEQLSEFTKDFPPCPYEYPIGDNNGK